MGSNVLYKEGLGHGVNLGRHVAARYPVYSSGSSEGSGEFQSTDL